MNSDLAIQCAHDWRRGPSDVLGRFHGTVCVLCGGNSIGRDWSMPEPTAAEMAALLVLQGPAKPTRRPSLRVRLRARVQRHRTRLASVIAGYDVDY